MLRSRADRSFLRMLRTQRPMGQTLDPAELTSDLQQEVGAGEGCDVGGGTASARSDGGVRSGQDPPFRDAHAARRLLRERGVHEGGSGGCV